MYRIEYKTNSMRKAADIAAGWYCGDGSGLYKILCNHDHNVLTLANWEQALAEVDAELAIQQDASKGPIDQKNIAELKWLRSYIIVKVATTL